MQKDCSSVDLKPYWKLIPVRAGQRTPDSSQDLWVVRLKPGVGFGNGHHETTQLCLLALGFLFRQGFRPNNVLDFGTGSGVLAVCAARFGARVDAIDIDFESLQHARENAVLNAVESKISLCETMSRPGTKYELVVANILCAVLLEYADQLCERQSRQGTMILSGLVSTDVPAILARYNPLLAPMRPEIYTRGIWRAIMYGSTP